MHRTMRRRTMPRKRVYECLVRPLVPMLILGSVVAARAAERQIPLIEAAKQGDVATVRALVKQKADVNVTEADGTTALHYAADRNDAAMTDLLLGAGANRSASNRFGAT